jgi:arginine N-succinyltransferase
MLRLRPATLDDIDSLLLLSEEAGTGMTTMPVDRKTWEAKLRLNEDSFAQRLEQAERAVFVLVLEHPDSSRLMGTCALIASVGNEFPFYSYKLSTQVMVSRELGINRRSQILHLVNDFTGCTELASLFLAGSYRGNPAYPGAGRFLSKARFLLIQDFPELFSSKIFAELRGYLDESGESPFWNALGKKFFGLEYSRADLLSAISGNQFISDLMPKYPIYLDLLPKSAQQVVGKVNLDSVPAKKLLEDEGFGFEGYVDIFDAGPTLQCQREHIYCLAQGGSGRLRLTNNPGEAATRWMVSNANLAKYRVVLCEGVLKGEFICLTAAAADALNIKEGDPVSWAPFGGTEK